MSTVNLVEVATDSILDFIKAGIGVSLNDVRVARADGLVQTPDPEDYFNFPTAPNRAPAIMLEVQEVDFRLAEKKANFVDAAMKIMLAVVVEDRTKDLIQRNAWRYQAALYSLLNGVHIDAANARSKIVVKIKKASFGPIYNAAAENGPEGRFRKEVILELEVEHYEGT